MLYNSLNLCSSPVFRFLLSIFCIINSITFSVLTIIRSFFALVIPVYNRFLVSSIGDVGGITIITTSNSLPCALCIVIA